MGGRAPIAANQGQPRALIGCDLSRRGEPSWWDFQVLSWRLWKGSWDSFGAPAAFAVGTSGRPETPFRQAPLPTLASSHSAPSHGGLKIKGVSTQFNNGQLMTERIVPVPFCSLFRTHYASINHPFFAEKTNPSIVPAR
jgi:hypothetical protein